MKTWICDIRIDEGLRDTAATIEVAFLSYNRSLGVRKGHGYLNLTRVRFTVILF